jgi:hypothetical protein
METTELSEPGAYSIEDFAKAHSISRAQTYIEIREGRLIGSKCGVRTLITAEDAATWRRSLPKMEAASAAQGE